MEEEYKESFGLIRFFPICSNERGPTANLTNLNYWRGCRGVSPRLENVHKTIAAAEPKVNA